jgi:hypothetical protein
MSDPTRLTQMTQGTEDGADVTASELALIRAGREARLSPQNKRRLWIGISAMTASASAATATAAASGSAVLTAVKATILVAAVGGGSIAGYQAWQHRERPVAVPAARTATSAPAAPATATATETEPETRGQPPQRPAGLAPVVAPAAPRFGSPGVKRAPESRLAAEGGVVLEARRYLREGRPEDALRLLDAARTEFAAGALAQEREALAIEALSRSGRRDAAQTRAAGFLRAYPGSPHAASVKSFAGH